MAGIQCMLLCFVAMAFSAQVVSFGVLENTASSITLLQTDISFDAGPMTDVSFDRKPTETSSESWSGAFNTWVFFHLGKAGGGSVNSRARQLELDLKQEHPSPPLPGTLEGYPNIMINIRDPVDRFVSAFNWRLDICCSPNDNRAFLPHVHDKLYNPEYSDKFCTDCTAKEAEALFVKYQSNVSILAEALCSESEETRTEAAADVLEILHAKDCLSDWLAAIPMETTESLLAFVLEPGFDFDLQVDAGFSWILGENGAEVSPDEFPPRQDNDASLHTSAGHGFPDLTEGGARCLAEYHTKDYQALETMIGKVETWCHGDESHTCAAALQSILDRRANLRRG